MGDANLGSPHDPDNNNAPLAGMRVLIILGPLELGGSERQALLFARYLKTEQSADVQVWGMMGGPGRVASLCDQYQIPWRIVPFPWVIGRIARPKALARFAWQLRQARPAIILPYMWLPSVACNLVWKWTGARLCIWNQRDHGLTRVPSMYEPRAVARTSLFVANSEDIAGYLVKELRASPDLIRIVHNGIELAVPEADRKAWRVRLDVTDNSFLACMVANLHQDKDHSTLLRAWKIVVDRVKKTGCTPVLVLAGRPDTTQEKLKLLAWDLKLCENLRFLGQVTDIAGLLGAVDLGVFSSRSEGSPNGVLECMAAGLPVVATNIPSIREVMPPEAHRFLVPPGDSESMADAIVALLADGDLRNQLGNVVRSHVKSHFSKEQMCESMLQVITEGLGQRLIAAKGADA